MLKSYEEDDISVASFDLGSLIDTDERLETRETKLQNKDRNKTSKFSNADSVSILSYSLDSLIDVDEYLECKGTELGNSSRSTKTDRKSELSQESEVEQVMLTQPIQTENLLFDKQNWEECKIRKADPDDYFWCLFQDTMYNDHKKIKKPWYKKMFFGVKGKEKLRPEKPTPVRVDSFKKDLLNYSNENCIGSLYFLPRNNKIPQETALAYFIQNLESWGNNWTLASKSLNLGSENRSEEIKCSKESLTSLTSRRFLFNKFRKKNLCYGYLKRKLKKQKTKRKKRNLNNNVINSSKIPQKFDNDKSTLIGGTVMKMEEERDKHNDHSKASSGTAFSDVNCLDQPQKFDIDKPTPRAETTQKMDEERDKNKEQSKTILDAGSHNNKSPEKLQKLDKDKTTPRMETTEKVEEDREEYKKQPALLKSLLAEIHKSFNTTTSRVEAIKKMEEEREKTKKQSYLDQELNRALEKIRVHKSESDSENESNFDDETDWGKSID
ncbi:hypothetical protein QYM36_007896 [Artemia franciscana]|uniref:Uncharacterized protein n=1 Tax=Artemia franciscana TaxID=6661 RepID=A0AA88LHJ5_ARTSF|nr:hypothetical protein QYM36_007896 [Artemia franciscana]